MANNSDVAQPPRPLRDPPIPPLQDPPSKPLHDQSTAMPLTGRVRKRAIEEFKVPPQQRERLMAAGASKPEILKLRPARHAT
jgi:hypothetical protein